MLCNECAGSSGRHVPNCPANDDLGEDEGYMKIIKTDNFCRDNVADSLVADNITNELYGKVMLEALNAKFSGEHSSDYYKLVADDYKLLEIDY